MKPKVPVVYRCPRNGEPAPCRTVPLNPDGTAKFPCGQAHTHQVEALVQPGQRVPECETHRTRLVP